MSILLDRPVVYCCCCCCCYCCWSHVLSSLAHIHSKQFPQYQGFGYWYKTSHLIFINWASTNWMQMSSYMRIIEKESGKSDVSKLTGRDVDSYPCWGSNLATAAVLLLVVVDGIHQLCNSLMSTVITWLWSLWQMRIYTHFGIFGLIT